MRTNYTAIGNAVERLEEARRDLNRTAGLRIGMISGGPSIDEEAAEFEVALREAISLVKAAIIAGARLSRLEEVVDGEFSCSEIIREEKTYKRILRGYELWARQE